MSKVSFRARALDANRPMPVFDADELTDLAEYAAINRAMPHMPTGMEKEEEMELHLQQAISAQQASCTGQSVAEQVVIPIPSVTSILADNFNQLYPTDFKPSKTLTKAHTLSLNEPSIPYYDIDSEDELFLGRIRKEIEISDNEFETIMDRLENASERQVASINDAKSLVAADDDVIITVYDYWLNKRLKLKRPLVSFVRSERKDGSTTFDPYVAFRRRGEKMQTRKNRKNDEESYEKILKLRQDLQRLVTLCDMVKRREKSKGELVNMDVEIFDYRYKAQDWSNLLYEQVSREAKPSFQFNKEDLNSSTSSGSPKHRPLAKSAGRKRKHGRKQGLAVEPDQGLVSKEWLIQNAEHWNRLTSSSPPIGSPVKPTQPMPPTRDPTALLDNSLTNQANHDIDGPFAFRRKRGCTYYAPNSFRQERDVGGLGTGHVLSNFGHTYLRTYTNNNLLRYTGLTQRRMGRGARMLFDRLHVRSPPPPPLLVDCPPSTSDAQIKLKKDESSHTSSYSTYFPANRLADMRSGSETARSDYPPPDDGTYVLTRPSSHLFYSRLPDNFLDTSDSFVDTHATGVGTDEGASAIICGPNGSFRVPLSIGVTHDQIGDQKEQLTVDAQANKKRFENWTAGVPVCGASAEPPSCIVDLEGAHMAGAAVMPAPQAMRLVINKDRQKTETIIEAQQTSNNNNKHTNVTSVNGNPSTNHNANTPIFVDFRHKIRTQKEPNPISRQNSEQMPSPNDFSYEQQPPSPLTILKGKSEQLNIMGKVVSGRRVSPVSMSPNSDGSLPAVQSAATNGEIDHNIVKQMTKPVR